MAVGRHAHVPVGFSSSANCAEVRGGESGLNVPSRHAGSPILQYTSTMRYTYSLVSLHCSNDICTLSGKVDAPCLHVQVGCSYVCLTFSGYSKYVSIYLSIYLSIYTSIYVSDLI